MGGAIGLLALDAEGVVRLDGVADAVDVGGGELETADSVAAVEGEAGESGGEDGRGVGGAGAVGGGLGGF